MSIKTKSFFTELPKKTRGFLPFPPRKYHKSYKFCISAPRTDKNMNLAPKCSSWKVPVRYSTVLRVKDMKGWGWEASNLTQAKKTFFQHTLKKSLEASFSDCKRPAAKLFIIQFYTFLLFKFLIYLQRFSCNRAFSVDADFEKIENAQKTSFFAVFSKEEIDEVLHRAICSQVYDCLFNSAHLAKKKFEFGWCV